jgi:hypothetical protein
MRTCRKGGAVELRFAIIGMGNLRCARVWGLLPCLGATQEENESSDQAKDDYTTDDATNNGANIGFFFAG